MSISLTHTTAAGGTDSADGKISKNAWNEAHTLSMATSKLLGRTTAGSGAVEEIGVAAALSLSAGSLGLTNDVANWPIFIASDSTSRSVGFAGFNTLTLATVTADSHSGWNSGTNVWTCPTGQGGTYYIVGKYRVVDAATSAASIGIGMHTSNADHADFFWGVTNPNRNGIENFRFMTLAAGDGVRLFAYLDTGAARNVIAASMSILRVR